MALMNAAARERLLAKQKEIREKMANSSFTKSWTLNGKNAIVAPGESKTVRLGPRWDFALLVDGKLTRNPEYDAGAEIHVEAIEHWWDADGGKTQHAWCPKTFDQDAQCPICDAAESMFASENEDDKKYAKRISAKQVFIFNAVVDRPRKVADGKADFRIMPVSRTIFDSIVDIMTGGADEQFARGNIGDPVEGYDIKLARPAKSGNDRWKVTVAPQPSRLYDETQKAAFEGWPGLLTNLPEMLQKEMKSTLELFKAFYGRDPEEGELAGAEYKADKPPVSKPTAAKAAPVQEDAPEAQTEETSTAPDPTDEFMTPAPVQSKAGVPPRVGPKTGGRR